MKPWEEYEERERQFAGDGGDFEGEEILKLIGAAGERIAALCLDDPAVGIAMTTLHKHLHLRGAYEDPQDWRKLWLDYSGTEADNMPLSQRVTSLSAYAFYGLSPRGTEGACSIENIREAIDVVKRALGQPVSAPDTSDLNRTILAAEGRLALDEGRSITLEQLAALTRLGIRSMRNVAAPSGGSGLEMHDGAATAKSTLTWLATRDDFKTSIWRHAGERGASKPSPAPSSPSRLEGEILWVPFASDGTEFDPKTCLRAGGYTIGRKGAEDKIEDYRAALGELARMRPSACWRRPNSAGNWGIVVAEGFRPRTAAELGLEPDGGER